MTEGEILAHAEALAKLQHDAPTERDFAVAERLIRSMPAGGLVYSRANGWHYPTQ